MDTQKVFIAAVCLALNLSLAKVAALLSLPVYLDTIGTVLSAVLLPWYVALVTASLTSICGLFIINPYWGFYIGTQLAIAITALTCVKAGFFKAWWQAIISGFIIALVAVLVSSPVTVLVFGGITLSGTTAINAVLIAAGQTIWKSVLTGSALIESIDKPLASFLAWMVINRLPKSFISNH